MSSAIVRELVTVLGFKTDLKGLKDAEMALLSFKTKMSLIASATLLALSKTLDFFSGIAENFVDTNNLSKATGIALENLLGMQRAAAQFGLRAADIATIFENINDLGRQALLGQGELLKIAEETGIQYKDNNGTLLSNEQIFQNILQYLGKIENEQQRIRIASLIFGKQFAQGISDISVDLSKFNEESKKYSDAVRDSVEAQAKAAQDFKKSVIDLENAWTSFVNTLGRYVLPVLEYFLKILTFLTEVSAHTIKGVAKVFSVSANALGNELNKDLLNDTQEEEIERFRKNVEEGNFSWWNLLGLPSPNAIPANMASSKSNNITANVDVNVQAGASIENAQEMGRMVADAVTEQLDYTINQIYNNYPQVE